MLEIRPPSSAEPVSALLEAASWAKDSSVASPAAHSSSRAWASSRGGVVLLLAGNAGLLVVLGGYQDVADVGGGRLIQGPALKADHIVVVDA